MNKDYEQREREIMEILLASLNREPNFSDEELEELYNVWVSLLPKLPSKRKLSGFEQSEISWYNATNQPDKVEEIIKYGRTIMTCQFFKEKYREKHITKI